MAEFELVNASCVHGFSQNNNKKKVNHENLQRNYLRLGNSL